MHTATGKAPTSSRRTREARTPPGWIHAYLHRKEGDAANAAYWYRSAAQPVAGDTLDEEWRRIAGALLARL
jgi:hypothetical protein